MYYICRKRCIVVKIQSYQLNSTMYAGLHSDIICNMYLTPGIRLMRLSTLFSLYGGGELH